MITYKKSKSELIYVIRVRLYLQITEPFISGMAGFIPAIPFGRKIENNNYTDPYNSTTQRG